jgi:hypothetical protein
MKNETDEIRLGKNKRGLIGAALTRASAADRNVPACPSPSQYPCAAFGFVNVKQRADKTQGRQGYVISD